MLIPLVPFPLGSLSPFKCVRVVLVLVGTPIQISECFLRACMGPPSNFPFKSVRVVSVPAQTIGNLQNSWHHQMRSQGRRRSDCTSTYTEQECPVSRTDLVTEADRPLPAPSLSNTGFHLAFSGNPHAFGDAVYTCMHVKTRCIEGRVTMPCTCCGLVAHVGWNHEIRVKNLLVWLRGWCMLGRLQACIHEDPFDLPKRFGCSAKRRHQCWWRHRR